MIDQYMEMIEDLAEVKKGTASVIRRNRTKRLVDENAAEVAKYANYAKRASMSGSEEDACFHRQKAGLKMPVPAL